MSPVVIRRATLADAPRLASHNRAMALETESKTLDPETVERGTRAVLEDASKGFYLVAERDGVTVGQLLVTYEWSDWRNGTFHWIQSVYVVPEARRTGVYRALYDHVLTSARADGGVAGIRLYAERRNVRAQATYEALGMQQAHYVMYEVDFVHGEG
jgi:ribosomal protein S18 acetylase RimI-like enzyme